MIVWEMAWGIGILVLLAALAWAFVRYKTRNRADDAVAEKATRELYKHPDTYEQKRPEFQREIRGNH